MNNCTGKVQPAKKLWLDAFSTIILWCPQTRHSDGADSSPADIHVKDGLVSLSSPLKQKPWWRWQLATDRCHQCCETRYQISRLGPTLFLPSCWTSAFEVGASFGLLPVHSQSQQLLQDLDVIPEAILSITAIPARPKLMIKIQMYHGNPPSVLLVAACVGSGADGGGGP